MFSVAPMMDLTDRHCRFFHRKLSAKSLLYTEMITAKAVLYGDTKNLLNNFQNKQFLDPVKENQYDLRPSEDIESGDS